MPPVQAMADVLMWSQVLGCRYAEPPTPDPEEHRYGPPRGNTQPLATATAVYL